MLRDKLIKWFFFSVVIALLPLLFSYARNLTRGNVIQFSYIFSNGELLLISSAIAATSIGELLDALININSSILIENKRHIYIVSGATIFLLMLNSLFFADVSAVLINNGQINREYVAIFSSSSFLCTIISSGCCVKLTEV
jgi:hypothetical protein